MTETQTSMVKPVAAVSIAVFRGDDVLVVERGKEPLRGLWSLPGGHIEPGEPARAAALRELLEETGVTASLAGVADLVDVIHRHDDGRLARHYVITVFAACWLAGEPRPASDSSAAAFLPAGRLAELPKTVDLDAVIERARSVYRSSLAAVQQAR